MKKGSALLLVLGMLAIVVVSAVAFSAFMRYSRLPSSYLRQSSSSRMLVKAAVAEAIDIVDASIADNPHPGVGYGTIRYPRGSGLKPAEDKDHTRNCWRNHVFTGSRRLVSASETVSTLSLEGLAYLPPALINEARYYSRHSTAAMWHSFGYDSGRFAFCAVDVSDHFNVNKIAADTARGSSPDNRFSLAYVFENADHTDYNKDLKPFAWDAFMKNYVDIPATKEVLTPWQTAAAAAAGSGKLPLVSVADLNLAVNKNGSQFRAYFPFVGYVTGLTDDFVTLPTGPVAEMQKHMAFVADGYFPPSGGTGEDADYDLADKEYQPFTEAELNAENVSLRAFVTKDGIGTPKTGKLLKDRLAAYGMVALYDYLDEDQVPVSLALPQTERSPMICGIRQEGLDGKLAIKKTRDPDKEVTDPDYPDEKCKYSGDKASATVREVEQTVYYKIDGEKFHKVFDSGKVTAVVAYPFRRGSGTDDSGKYALDGHLEFFFTREEQGFRSDAGNSDVLHMAGDSDFTGADVKESAVFHVPLVFKVGGADNITPANFGTGDDEVAQSVREYTARLRDGTPAPGNIQQFLDSNDHALLRVDYKYSQKREKNESTGAMGPWQNVGDPEKPGATVGVLPVKKGVADTAVSNGAEALKIATEGATYKLRTAVWLRIKNLDEGKTVDLVPACVHDDQQFLGNNNSSEPESIKMTGAAYPLMLFTGGQQLELKESSLKEAAENGTESDFALSPQGVMVSDPRWNWAPEHWYRYDAVSKETWLEEVKNQLGRDGRDSDIFMAVSDANYMQSVYEIAFLPRLTSLDNAGGSSICGNMTRLQNAGRTEWATKFDEAANNDFMWRTYRLYARNGEGGRDNFEDLGIVSDGGGTKLNPYSDNENILVAAFANSPRCWWAASANTETGIEKDERVKSVDEFNKKYAWCAMNNVAKFDWKDLKNVVTKFKEKMQSQTRVDGWESAYSELWAEDSGNADRLMGVTLEGETSDLYDVDRKFLYGYWRDCFAVKQQLFLIFVRAEPMMMGGGKIGQTPPQLGARAVALVWRNPVRDEASVEEYPNGPHQTRVLFYRQFD